MSEISAEKDIPLAALENKRGIKGANQERMRQEAAESPKSAEHLKKNQTINMLDIRRMYSNQEGTRMEHEWNKGWNQWVQYQAELAQNTGSTWNGI